MDTDTSNCSSSEISSSSSSSSSSSIRQASKNASVTVTEGLKAVGERWDDAATRRIMAGIEGHLEGLRQVLYSPSAPEVAGALPSAFLRHDTAHEAESLGQGALEARVHEDGFEILSSQTRDSSF